jgi:CTP synthase (UTP-ammonia lyase)
VEYARNVLAIADAEHAETAPEAPYLVISPLTCSLVGTAQTIKLLPGTLAYQVYEKDEVTEQFMCNYGLNPAYRDSISTGGLKVVGLDTAGEVRAVELSAHRFFIATLFLPQLSSGPDMPHPLIVAYLREAQAFHAFQNDAPRSGRSWWRG